MAFNLRNYENQAKFSIGLAAAGGVFLLGALATIIKVFDWSNFWLPYKPTAKRIIIIGIGLLVALAAGVVGFFVALNSAGQKRNKLSRLSWTAFFLNAALLTLSLTTALFCFLTKYQVRDK